MRSWKLPVALALTIGGAVAVGALFLTRVFAVQEMVDVATLAVIVAALIGLYVLLVELGQAVKPSGVLS